MFTGLVEELGTVGSVQRTGRSLHLTIAASRVVQDLAVGDSIAVNGVCLTAVAVKGSSFTADVMPETFANTTLRELRPGAPVNLERSLRMGDRLGGHLVQGHVDSIGRITGLEEAEIARLVTISAPPAVTRYVVPRGSIAVDGVSLTVVSVEAAAFRVSLIPHTAAVTTLGQRRVGDLVNLETDIIGRYVERLLSAGGQLEPPSRVTRDLLARTGFLGPGG